MAPTIKHNAIVAVDSSQTDHSQLDNKIVVAWDAKQDSPHFAVFSQE